MAQAAVETDREKVFAWAMEHFLDLGFSEQQSEDLADEGAEWHAAQKLLNKGCPVEVAFEIMRA